MHPIGTGALCEIRAIVDEEGDITAACDRRQNFSGAKHRSISRRRALRLYPELHAGDIARIKRSGEDVGKG
jgi:hypothetical protein